ncbi:SagB/ThcOx family dehydrogenase [Xanthobacter sp. KR7-225]|uniref:SagB/ThcOx family dehydrogenase n=1 Tax=Xanthobacter sp. KR7-225 TaxID=3156613 RepID=UPI0032B5C79C
MSHPNTALADPPPEAAEAQARRAGTALGYHQRTKHTLKAYAAGPETLDWDAQPDPFRTYDGAPARALPLTARALDTRFCDLFGSDAPPPAPLGRDSVAALLELSFGLSAFKQLGPDRWAVRANPSSGNLHPTEAYVLARGVAGLDDGVHHYVSRDHALERRARLAPGPARLLIGLSSVAWREAWKYGERAFRYCQLDTGHALGALIHAAAALGWRVRLVPAGAGALAALLGLDRAADFAGGAEREDPELLAEILVGAPAPEGLPALAADPDWRGHANLLDRHPLYRWPVIDAVSVATAAPDAAPQPEAGPARPVAPPAPPPPDGGGAVRAAALILGRRSAQRFDTRAMLPAADFFRLLAALDPGAPAFSVWDFAPRLHPVLFVHRVEGLPRGVYALPRRPGMAGTLKAAMRADFDWSPAPGAPDHLPLFCLAEADARGVARTVCCHQAIAGDGAFSLALLAEFAPLVARDPWRYRQLHWEAGLLGQALYLAAEAAGIRGTGIGCYFDDEVHRLLGLAGADLQSLYHFTVGTPLDDPRILSEPAYAGRPL